MIDLCTFAHLGPEITSPSKGSTLISKAHILEPISLGNDGSLGIPLYHFEAAVDFLYHLHDCS